MIKRLLSGLLPVVFLFSSACAGPDTSVQAENSRESAEPESAAGPPAWIRAGRVQPRGLIRNEPDATPGFVLFTQLNHDTSFLIDREGRVVHTWTTDLAADAGYLLEDGSLLRQARLAEPPNFRAGGVAGYLQRVSWDGEVLWQWRMGDTERILHHDLAVLPNGNILVIAWEQISAEEARAAGRRPDLIPEQGLWADWVLEVRPIPPNDAEIVWQWHVWDHLVQDFDPAAPNYGDPADHPHRLDVNADGGHKPIDAEELEQLKALGYIPDDATEEDIQSDFLHMNAVDYNPNLDQIALSTPETGEIWIIDHSTTPAEARTSSGGRSGRGGDLLYRWGNPAVYRRGAPSDQRLFYQHQVLWIPDGQDRAGNLTVFNNGGDRGWSSILEIEPPLQADGSYRMQENGVWGPAEPAWRYVAADREDFYAPFISGAHRLENGNTFICSGPQGWFFEVTPDGRVVWEYRNPYHGTVPGWSPPGVEKVPYASYRATKIEPDHPALRGRDLQPVVPQPEPFVLPSQAD